MKRLIFVLVLLVASGCSAFDFLNVPASTPSIGITTDEFDSLIFTADSAALPGLEFGFNDPIVEYWTPTEEQVVELEAGVLDYLDEMIAPDHYGREILERLLYYRRQYFGIGFSEGEQLIYASYFCAEDSFDYWLESHVMVLDGGECFFQFFYDLRINGMA